MQTDFGLSFELSFFRHGVYKTVREKDIFFALFGATL